MKRGKKAQLKLSFGMVFSIILIIIFIAFAFFGIRKFLGIQEIAQIETFKSDLQDDIDKMWASTSGSQEVEYNLPRSVDGICFTDDEYYNLFFYPDEFNRGTLEHLDILKTLDNEDELCFSTSDRKITMTIQKDYGDSLVAISGEELISENINGGSYSGGGDSGDGSSEGSGDIFNIYFSQDFEDNPLGTYNSDAWAEDWNYPPWANHDNGYGYIIQESENKFLRESFPLGTFLLDEAGVQWLTPLDSAHDELYFSYKVKFSSGFTNTDLQGKLPGLSGGESTAGGNLPDGTDGWSARYMFHGTYLRLYLYHPELYLKYGDPEPVPGKDYYGQSIVFDSSIPIKTGKWYVITQRIVMNSVGNHDGLAEAYVDGELAAQKTGMRWRDIPTLQIDTISFGNFLGGSGEPTSSTEYIYFDDFIVFDYKEDADVARGNNPAQSGTTIPLP